MIAEETSAVTARRAYEAMSFGELRHLVRERGLAATIPHEIRKPDLIALLMGEVTDLQSLAGERRSAPTAQARTAADASVAELIASMVSARLDEELDARRDQIKPTVTVNLPEGRAVEFKGRTHRQFSTVLKLVSSGIPVLLVGPAGSGKTELCRQIAEALDLPFTFNSMSAGVTEASLLGRVLPDASGNWTYRPAPFVTTYERGGVHLFDELDAADPNLMVVVNAAIANGHLAIPFADIPPVKRSPKCFIIAAANTFGNGADRQYVGRNQLDAATVDRFTMGTVVVDYDRDLERELTVAVCGEEAAEPLLTWAWNVRDRIAACKLRRLMSTRSILNAARRMAAGDSLADIEATYFQSWTADERAKVA